VGLPGGAEAAGWAARLFAERNPEWTVIKLDLRNAYGETQRAVALQELAALQSEEAEALHLFCSLMLEGPTLLHFAGTLLRVEDGLDQGDPAAPLLFCLALQPVLRALKAALPQGAFVQAYLDDIVMVVPRDAAEAALTTAERLAEEAGYEVQRGAPDRPKSLMTSVQGDRPEPCSLPWAENGFSVAGVPIPRKHEGTIARQIAEEAVRRLEAETQTLRELVVEGPGGRSRVTSARRILLICMASRLDFLSRCAEPAHIRQPVERFDSIIHNTFHSIMALPDDLADLTATQLSYSPASGGYGLSSLGPRLDANFVDGALSAAPHVAKATGAGPMLALPLFVPLEQALEASAAHVAAVARCDTPGWFARAAGNKNHRRWGAEAWKSLSKTRRQMDQAQRAAHGLAVDGKAVARVDSCSGQGAGWVTSPAAVGGAELLFNGTPEGPPMRVDVRQLELTDEEEHALVKFRLGIFVRPGGCRRMSRDPRAGKPGGPRKFCLCKNDASISGDHLVICPYGGWTIARHNRLARLLQMLILEIPGAEVRWTPRTAHWVRGSEPAEPDLRVDVPGWGRLYIDVAIVSPQKGAPGRAAADEEAAKVRLYPVWVIQARAVQCDFSPCVLETYGRFGNRTRLLVCRLATRAAQENRVNVASEIARWQQLLSLRLAKDEADLLING